MGKFKEFKKEQYEKKKSRSLKLPSVFVGHGKHSLTMTEKASKLKDDKKKSLSEGRMADDVERSQAEHTEIHSDNKVDQKKISEPEKAVLSDYADDSKPTNLPLINYHNGHSWKESASKSVEHLDKVLEKHKTKKDFHVYSGINWSPSQHMKNKAEGESHVDVHMPAYTSTSTSIKQAAGFASLQYPHPDDEKHGAIKIGDEDTARHMLRIHVPKGTHAISMMKHSFNPGEKEILLHRGHELRIHHKPQRYQDHNGDMINVWDAHITGHYPTNVHEEDL